MKEQLAIDLMERCSEMETFLSTLGDDEDKLQLKLLLTKMVADGFKSFILLTQMLLEERGDDDDEVFETITLVTKRLTFTLLELGVKIKLNANQNVEKTETTETAE